MARPRPDGIASTAQPATASQAVARAVHAIEGAVQRARSTTLETIAPMRDDLTLMLPAAAA